MHSKYQGAGILVLILSISGCSEPQQSAHDSQAVAAAPAAMSAEEAKAQDMATASDFNSKVAGIISQAEDAQADYKREVGKAIAYNDTIGAYRAASDYSAAMQNGVQRASDLPTPSLHLAGWQDYASKTKEALTDGLKARETAAGMLVQISNGEEKSPAEMAQMQDIARYGDAHLMTAGALASMVLIQLGVKSEDIDYKTLLPKTAGQLAARQKKHKRKKADATTTQNPEMDYPNQ